MIAKCTDRSVAAFRSASHVTTHAAPLPRVQPYTMDSMTNTQINNVSDVCFVFASRQRGSCAPSVSTVISFEPPDRRTRPSSDASAAGAGARFHRRRASAWWIRTNTGSTAGARTSRGERSVGRARPVGRRAERSARVSHPGCLSGPGSASSSCARRPWPTPITSTSTRCWRTPSTTIARTN